MHTPEWRDRASANCAASSDQLVILDYPSARSFAALQSSFRRDAPAVWASGPKPYRVFSTAEIVEARLAAAGFRVRSVHRQFVLPIAFHKVIGSRRFTLAIEADARSARAAGSFSARP